MSTKVKRIGKLLVFYNAGRFLAGLIQWAVSFAILIKVYGWPFWFNLWVVPLTAVFTVTVGWAYDRFGLRKAFDEEVAVYWVDKINRGD